MWVKWAEMREKWQQGRKKKRGGFDTILHEHILLKWRLYSSYISGLPAISVGWNSIDSPSLPAVRGNVSVQGQALEIFWAGPVPHPSWLLEKPFSLLLEMYKHLKEMLHCKGSIQKYLPCGDCLLAHMLPCHPWNRRLNPEPCCQVVWHKLDCPRHYARSCEPQLTPYFTFSLAHVINCWWSKPAGNVACSGCHDGRLGEKQNKASAHSSHSLITFSWVNGKSVALSWLVCGYGGHRTCRGVCVCVRLFLCIFKILLGSVNYILVPNLGYKESSMMSVVLLWQMLHFSWYHIVLLRWLEYHTWQWWIIYSRPTAIYPVVPSAIKIRFLS